MSNDTQHYTNLEIFHSLVPKMKAAFPHIGNWDELDKEENYDDYRYIIDAIAIAYRSGYGRGQKGRSFLIGEKKANHKSNLVCWIGQTKDHYYTPKMVGTVGKIDYIDVDGDLWVFWPAHSCDVYDAVKVMQNTSYCCEKRDCLRIDTNVKGNIKKGDKIVYLGTENGFKFDDVWPNKVATGVVDFVNDDGVCVNWDDPSVVGDWFNGRTHVWYEDIAKVIPWD